MASVRVDARELVRLATRLEIAASDKEVARALIDTRRRAKTFAIRKIREAYTVKRKAFTPRRLRTISRGEDGFDLLATASEIRVDGFAGTRASKRSGVTYQAKKGGERRRVPRGFRLPNGGFVQRAVIDDKRVGRLPLEGIFGPAMARMLEDADVLPEIEAFFIDTLRAALDRRLDRVVRR